MARARVNSIFLRYDRDKTAAKVDLMLSGYRSAKNMSKRAVAPLQSPAIDGMPRNQSVRNSQEDKIIGNLSASEFALQCEERLEMVKNRDFRTILRQTYFVYNPPVDDVIMENVGLEHSAYYETKKKALFAFAEVWPPEGTSELLVKK